MYYKVLLDYLHTATYTLADAAGRIDYGVAAGKLTPDEAAELIGVAQSHSTAGTVDQAITALAERVASLEAHVAALYTSEDDEDSGGETDPPDDGILSWVPPVGAHDAPNIGDKRRHNGKLWESQIAGNTTEPGSDPRWWAEIG